MNSKLMVGTIWNVSSFNEAYKAFLERYGDYEIADTVPIISKTNEILGYKFHFYVLV